MRTFRLKRFMLAINRQRGRDIFPYYQSRILMPASLRVFANFIRVSPGLNVFGCWAVSGLIYVLLNLLVWPGHCGGGQSQVLRIVRYRNLM